MPDSSKSSTVIPFNLTTILSLSPQNSFRWKTEGLDTNCQNHIASGKWWQDFYYLISIDLLQNCMIILKSNLDRKGITVSLKSFNCFFQIHDKLFFNSLVIKYIYDRILKPLKHSDYIGVFILWKFTVVYNLQSVCFSVCYNLIKQFI